MVRYCSISTMEPGIGLIERTGLGVFCGVRDSVIGADALVLKGIGVTVVDETATRLLIEAEKTARRNLIFNYC